MRESRDWNRSIPTSIAELAEGSMIIQATTATYVTPNLIDQFGCLIVLDVFSTIATVIYYTNYRLLWQIGNPKLCLACGLDRRQNMFPMISPYTRLLL